MPATQAQLAALAAPTPKDKVKTKPGRGGSGTLSFIDTRFVFDRFDAALGPHLWQLEVPFSPPIHSPEITTRNGKVLFPEWTSSYPMARIGVLTEQGWVWRQDVGDFSDIEPVKGAVSDSIKRCAVQWGVGRDLYDKESAVYSTTPDAPAQADLTAEAKAAFSDVAEAAVVGKTGLTNPQKAMLFALLREQGISDDKRKELVHDITGKWSTKDMSNEDLDLVVKYFEAGK